MRCFIVDVSACYNVFPLLWERGGLWLGEVCVFDLIPFLLHRERGAVFILLVLCEIH